MQMRPDNGFAGFKVVDDAAGAEIKNVVWVDDVALEYCVYAPWPAASTTIVKVTAVRVHHVAKEIHVNAPPVKAFGVDYSVEKPASACDACCQEATCRRIHYCAAYRCGFGEVDKP